MPTPPLIPAKAGTQSFGHSACTESAPTAIPSAGASLKHWVPAFAGMIGNEIQGLAA